MIDITKQFLASVGGTPARSDLFVCDVARIDRTKCAALIAHHPDLGTPKMDDVYAYVRRAFDGKLVPQMSTAKAHPYEHAISIVLTANMMQRPAGDKDTMRRITASMYAEDKTASLWSLISNSDGSQYLVRNVDEDVHDIVARATRRNPHHPGATLASLKQAAPFLDEGDCVKFFGDNNQVLFGCVTSISGDHVTIKADPGGQSYTVSRYAVAEVMSKGKGAISKEKAKLEDFFATIFGSREFAQKLTQRDVNDEGVRDSIPTFEAKK